MAGFRALWSRLLTSHSYGFVLALIVLTFVWAISFPSQQWARVVLVALQSVTLLTALWASKTPHRLQFWARIACVLAILGSVPAAWNGGELARIAAGFVSLALVAVTPVAIFHSARSFSTITARTITGALCVYLLVGMFFAAVYGLIDDVNDGAFFVQTADATYSDYLYYSYITQTTVGFGDLTTASDVGRAFTSVEALLSQIYLVTVVSMIVANLGRPRSSAREELEGNA